MKKIKTKILIGFGVTTTLLTAGSVFISCGSNGNSTLEQKLDAIKTQDIINAITAKLAPTTSKPVPEAPENNKFTDLLIDGLGGVIITIADYARGTIDGSVKFSITSITEGSTTISGFKFGIIEISGFEVLTFSKRNNVPQAINIIQTRSNKYFVGTSENGLWVSAFEENNFKPLPITSGIGHDWAITSICYASNGKIFIVAKSPNKHGQRTIPEGVWVSSNDGDSFKQLSIEPDDRDANVIYQTSNNQIFVGTGINGLWNSTNGGVSWSQVLNDKEGLTETSDINSVFQTSNGRIYLGLNKGLWVSDSKGLNFVQVEIGGYETTVLVIQSIFQGIDGTIFFTTSTEGLWKSTDQGTTWSQVTGAFGIGTAWQMNTILETNNGIIWVTTAKKGLFCSIDKGKTYNHVDSFLSKDNWTGLIFQLPDGKIQVGTTDSMFISSDSV